MKKLTTAQVKRLGEFDKASRWYPCEDVAEYFSNIRSPSRAWPYSYYKSAHTGKFYKWMENNRPDILALLNNAR